MSAKFKDIIFTVTVEETTTLKNSITSEPVESGSAITDHVKSEPKSISINGVIVGKDAAKQFSKLSIYAETGQIGQYVGRVILSNCVIESFSSTRNKGISNGFEFSVTFTEIPIASKQSIKINVSKLNIPEIKTKEKKGKQAKKKKKKQSALEKLKARF